MMYTISNPETKNQRVGSHRFSQPSITTKHKTLWHFSLAMYSLLLCYLISTMANIWSSLSMHSKLMLLVLVTMTSTLKSKLSWSWKIWLTFLGYWATCMTERREIGLEKLNSTLFFTGVQRKLEYSGSLKRNGWIPYSCRIFRDVSIWTS